MAKKAIRPIRVEGNVAYVPLTQGYEAIIDATDVPLVRGFNWWAKVSRRPDGSVYSVYACRTFGPACEQKREYMHRALMAGLSDTIDHADGNGLHNTRANLRAATVSQNMQNTRLRSNNTSGVKGVSWSPKDKRWYAYINIAGKRHRLGGFKEIDLATAAISDARSVLHGEYGRST